MLAYTSGDSTKAGNATEIEFYMQAHESLQALIIPNLCVVTCLCEIHHMATQDQAKD